MSPKNITAAVEPHGRKVVKICFCSSVGHVGSNALDKRSGSGVFKNGGAQSATAADKSTVCLA